MNYRRMIVWKKAMEFIDMTCDVVWRLPQGELYALSSQMRRAVVSIASNIAEGAGRGTDKDLRHFMTIARGLATELETQSLICLRLNYMTAEEIRPCMLLLDEIRRMLTILSIRGKAKAEIRDWTSRI